MNTDNFQKYIYQPNNLGANSIAEFQEILTDYPYFQAAHFLQLKALYKQNSFKFNSQLKQSAIYVPNRKKLYYFLKEIQTEPKNLTPKAKKKSKVIVPEETTQGVKLKPENNISPKGKIETAIEKTKKRKTKEIKLTPQNILEKRLEELKNKNLKNTTKNEDKAKSVLKQEIQKNNKSNIKDINFEPFNDFNSIDTVSDLLEISPPVEYFTKKPTRKEKEKQSREGTDKTFENWLNNFHEKHNITNKKNPKAHLEKEGSKSKIIDRFLSDKSSKIIKAESNVPNSSIIIKDKAEDDTGFMTETLAKIYTQQKQFKKAIEAYQKLSSKHPEKNNYFYTQIERIKEIEENLT